MLLVGGVCPGGVSARGGSCPGGEGLSAQGGVYFADGRKLSQILLMKLLVLKQLVMDRN